MSSNGTACFVTNLDRMLQPDEARSIVISHAHPIGSEVVPLTEAGSRILTKPLIASESLPAFRASTMDGFAVVHNDDTPAKRILEGGLAGEVRDHRVERSVAARIMTGAPVPDGADAVVPVENTVVDGGTVRITQSRVRSGDNIRPIGSDMEAGDEILPAGIGLKAPDLGLLASLGHATVEVGRKPRVAVFSTGDEIVAPDAVPGPGQIRDANRFTLAFAAQQAGASVVINSHIPDEEAALRDAFSQALDVADVIVTSGGVSMGDRDLVKALLGEIAEVHFRRVFMKPGKPLNFATAGDKLIFGLPGNPVSCLVSFHVFARPALAVLQGAAAEETAPVPVIIQSDVQPSDRIEFQRARISVLPDGRLTASTTGPQQSSRLQSFVGANGYLIVPPTDAVVPAGSILSATLFSPPYPAQN